MQRQFFASSYFGVGCAARHLYCFDHFFLQKAKDRLGGLLSVSPALSKRLEEMKGFVENGV